MLKLLKSSEKLELCKSLQNLMQQYKQQCKMDQFWHARRLHNSLTFELMPQQVFVDSFPNYSFIINKYINKNNGYNLELYTTNRDKITCKVASEMAVSMVHDKSMNFAQIQACPYYLHRHLNLAIKRENLHIIEDICSNCMLYPEDKLEWLKQSIKPVKGFKCQQLTGSDAETVNNNFKYARSPDTFKWIKKSLETQPSIGCWEEKTGKLVGQFIVTDSGNTGGLVVDDAYKGLKLGKWIAQEMTKLQLEQNEPLILETEFQNKLSYTLFTSIGYQTVTHSYYMLFHREPVIDVEY